MGQAHADRVSTELEAAVAANGHVIEDWKSLYDKLCAAIPAEAKPLSTRERDSLLKLVIGLAVKGYGFQPRAARSQVPSEIAGDLDQLGIGLDADTVRKYLKEGTELLPPDAVGKDSL